MGKRLLMDEKELSSLDIAAALHDVGKIGVPEAILDKPGRLDEREMEVVRRHSTIGAGIVEDIPDYAEVRSAILYHHERWDGSGYPEGLAGEKIPFFARIIALADVYDAITDDRPYRKGMRLEEARSFIEKSAGSLFDPGLTRIFLEVVSDREKDGSVAAIAADSA
jgi:HD-GYP domain-containing protein (c-di-GMP phosphodiesterase class II)